MKKALKYLIPFLICAVVVILILVSRGAFVKSGRGLVLDLCDAFSVSGALMFGIGLLVFVTNGGAFDMLAFGFIKLIDLFKRDLTKVKYRTFYDYREAQKEKKRTFVNLLIVGGAYLLVGIALLLVFNFYPWAR